MGRGSEPSRVAPHPEQAAGLQVRVSASCSGGTRGRVARLWPGWPPRFLPEGVRGGCRLRWMGSVDGGRDELRELESESGLEGADLILKGGDLELHRLDEGPHLDRQGVPDFRR